MRFFLNITIQYSVNWATKVQDIFTYAKLLALFIIIAVGMYLLAQGKLAIFPSLKLRLNSVSTGNVQYFTFENTKTEVTSIALSFYSGLFAYNG